MSLLNACGTIVLTPVSATLALEQTVSATAWTDVTGLSITIAALANERVLCCVAGQCVAAAGTTTGQQTLSINGVDIVNGAGDGLSAWYGPQWSRHGIGIAYLSDALAVGNRIIKVRAKKQGGGDANYLIKVTTRLSLIRLVG